MRTLQELSDSEERRYPIIAITSGSGLAIKAAVSAEIDFILALNSSLYRAMGWGTAAGYMPFGDANLETRNLIAQHIRPHAGKVPIVAGLLARPDGSVEYELEELKNLGVQGVVNWPALSQFDEGLRHALAEDGFTPAWEIESLKRARSAGFFTFGFVYNAEQAREFARSGVDALILGLGITRRYDDIHERRGRIQHEITYLKTMLESVEQGGRRPLCLAAGGSTTMPEDFEQLFRFCSIDGFVGGAAFESIPVHEIVSSMVRRFKSVGLRQDPNQAGSSELSMIVGRSAPIKEVLSRIKRVAPHDVNVCIEGESGTGKELAATLLHRMSRRSHQAFVTLNCGAIPDTLLESELFGHEKGAFTGAVRRRIGKFEQAHRGTLFLDEIANLSPHGQAALLRAIQQREITPVGAEDYIPVDVRVLAASNQPLAALVGAGKFRADLYHRLNQFTLALPPLRERRDDIPLLVNDMLPRFEVQLDKKLMGVSPGFLKKLNAHGWPGNIRELQHAILSAALCEDGTILHGDDFQVASEAPAPSESKNGDWSRTWLETVRQAMQDSAGNKSRAATALGVTRKTLYKWLRQL